MSKKDIHRTVVVQFISCVSLLYVSLAKAAESGNESMANGLANEITTAFELCNTRAHNTTSREKIKCACDLGFSLLYNRELSHYFLLLQGEMLAKCVLSVR